MSRHNGNKIIGKFDVRCDDTDNRYECLLRMLDGSGHTTRFRVECLLLEISITGENVDALKKQIRQEIQVKGKVTWERWYSIEVQHISGKEADERLEGGPEERGIRIKLERLLRSAIGTPGERYREANKDWEAASQSWTRKGVPESGECDTEDFNREDPKMHSLIKATPEVEEAIGGIMAKISELYAKLSKLLSPVAVEATIKMLAAGGAGDGSFLALPTPPSPKKKSRR